MVSVVIPYRHDRGFLQEALDSIRQQTYTDHEVIRISSPNNLSFNINKGTELAKGEFICFLSDDDTLPPDSLKDRVEAMEHYDFIHSRGLRVYETGFKPYGLTNPYAQFNSVLENNGIMGGSTMYRTEILKENLFREDLDTAEEWELHLRLLSKGYRLGFLDKVTYHYRQHPQQKSIGNLSKEYQDKRQQTKDMIKGWYTQAQ